MQKKIEEPASSIFLDDVTPRSERDVFARDLAATGRGIRDRRFVHLSG